VYRRREDMSVLLFTLHRWDQILVTLDVRELERPLHESRPSFCARCAHNADQVAVHLVEDLVAPSRLV
jgi:hypothetical protein